MRSVYFLPTACKVQAGRDDHNGAAADREDRGADAAGGRKADDLGIRDFQGIGILMIRFLIRINLRFTGRIVLLILCRIDRNLFTVAFYYFTVYRNLVAL